MAPAHATKIETRSAIPGMDPDVGHRTAGILKERLVAVLDLTLTLKHVHWNVVGPAFIGVHKMLDEQVDAVRLMSDESAEHIAALGATSNGLAGSLVAARSWDDYSLMRGTTLEHLGGLDLVYDGVIQGHRDRDGRTRRDRAGLPGRPDRSAQDARAVPLVRTGASRIVRRTTVDRRRQQ